MKNNKALLSSVEGKQVHLIKLKIEQKISKTKSEKATRRTHLVPPVAKVQLPKLNLFTI